MIYTNGLFLYLWGKKAVIRLAASALVGVAFV